MANHRKDYTGRRFGRLVAIERLEGPKTRYRCTCDCGNEHIAIAGNLQSGGVESCGCLRREQKQAHMRTIAGRNAAELTGQRFGKLIVLRRMPSERRTLWECLCDCGAMSIKKGKYLVNGDTRSCGCEQRAYRASGHNKYSDMPEKFPREYSVWRSMKSRCYVKSSSGYRFYGARGVTVCDRWRTDFRAFITDMGPCPENLTIDRIDPSGNYAPENCRWATWEVQYHNKRPTQRPRDPALAPRLRARDGRFRPTPEAH